MNRVIDSYHVLAYAGYIRKKMRNGYDFKYNY